MQKLIDLVQKERHRKLAELANIIRVAVGVAFGGDKDKSGKSIWKPFMSSLVEGLDKDPQPEEQTDSDRFKMAVKMGKLG